MSEADEAEDISQGFRWEGSNPDRLRDVVEAAFDYRGDVTLLLEGGESVTGYLANRDLSADEPYIDMMCASGDRPRVLYAKVRGVEFSGRDTASGKSWESWLKKWNEKKEAEARGEDVGDISLFPDEGD